MEIKPNFGQQVSQLAKSDDRPAGGIGGLVSQAARSDKQLDLESLTNTQNQAILDASLQVSISSGNNPMELLFRAAINTLNEVLATDLDTTPVQSAYESDLDVSPEATAGRIVSLSTAFFDQYLEQHPEMSAEEARPAFADVIRGGIEEGFAQARKMLDGLHVLEGEIAAGIDRTLSLVLQGLDAFSAPASDTPATIPSETEV